MTANPTCGPKWLYLHGFASGPESSKGRALAARFATQGVEMERLDLRKPSMEGLLLSTMIEHVQERIGSAADRAVVLGSSLGGLTAARVAERDPRVCALVLLAPAFRMFERWRARLGDEAWRAWRESGYLTVDDYATRGKARVHFGFTTDADAIDVGFPDVRVPTLVIHGVHDDVVPIEGSREWTRGKPHVRLVEVDDGHELVKSVQRIGDLAETFLHGFLHGAR